MLKKKLAPECQYGYTDAQIQQMFEEPKKFYSWMRGQTFSSCDGREYNRDTEQYVATNCGPHGFVYYPWDVYRYVNGLPVID